MLNELYNLTKALESNSSQKEKKQILKEGMTPQIESVLRTVYDPFLQYYLTHETAMKKGHKSPLVQETELHPILEALSKRNLSGQAAQDTWKSFVLSQAKELQEIAGRILDKDLKCRIGVKTINKVLVELGRMPIDDFAVAKGYLYEGEDVWNEDWYLSRKYDGVRGNVILGKGDPIILSTNGFAFDVFDRLLSEFANKYDGPPCIFDGELALKTDGDDDFQGLMKRLRRKEHQIPDAHIHLFDWIPLNPKDQRTFKLSKRQEILQTHLNYMDSPYMKLVKQIKIKSKEHMERLTQKAFDRGWEGTILRKDAPFKAGKSRDICKRKKKEDAEFKVIDAEFGEMNIVVNGREKSVNIMKNAVIKVKGCRVGVGSGWSVEQRQEFYKHPERIIGKIITVEYDKITKNQKGGYGLRFPVVKWIHGEERKL